VQTRHVYDRQAQTYDATRGASPSVLGPLKDALAGAPGRFVVDIGGGTGNYANVLRREGWKPLVVDCNAAMLARAEAKGLSTLQADAVALPLPDGVADAAMLVAMLHHVADWRAALREARRILRPAGRLALMGWTREHLEHVTWLRRYFPSMDEWLASDHPTLSEIERELPRARVFLVHFEDLEDGSLAALQRRPELLLEPAWRRQTSYFEKLEFRFPDELKSGLDRLRDDIEAGRDPNTLVADARMRWGDAVVLAWTKP
jgi:ubiquinone/menaquinone biosynthesis C-methylase UbiE